MNTLLSLGKEACFFFLKRLLKSFYPPSSVCNILNSMRKFILLMKKAQQYECDRRATWVTMNKLLISKIKPNEMHNKIPGTGSQSLLTSSNKYHNMTRLCSQTT